MSDDIAKLLSNAQTAKNLKDSAQNAKDFGDKASDVKDATDSFSDLINSIIPYQGPLSLFLGEIQSKTAAANTQLLTDLIDAIQSKTGQDFVKAIGRLLNEILTGASQITETLAQSPNAQNVLTSFAATLDLVTADISHFNDQLERFQTAGSKFSISGLFNYHQVNPSGNGANGIGEGNLGNGGQLQ